MITQERLKELLDYNPETGIFVWKVNCGKNRNLGKIAGSLHNQGYWTISIENKGYLAHRLAWLYVYGSWPVFDTDHKDLNKTHNWIDNLREATRSENCQNAVMAQKSNKSSGLLGVSLDKRRKKYRANIVINGKQKFLGYFDLPEFAHAAYIEAKRIYHPFGRI